MDLLNLADWEAAAKAKLSPMAFGYYASGANDEITLCRNRKAFEDVEVYHRVLRDVSKRSTVCKVLGETLQTPILVAPSAFHQLACEEGELATVRGVAAAGSLMTLSTLSNKAIEQVAAETNAPLWFQLYIYKDRAITNAVLDRAEAAGCKAIVFTVDAPLLGRREGDIRNRFHLPEGFRMENVLPHGYGALQEIENASSLASYFSELLDPAIAWSDLDWLCQKTRLPVLVKGIVHPEDARFALNHGAAGIIVSNHGGRQLDTGPATIRALPGVAKELAGMKTHHGEKPWLLLDGGIRRGTDVLKALALGADAVLLGRPILWGLANQGAAGVAAVLNLLRDELDLAMGLCGCRNLAEITEDLIFPSS